MAKRQLTKRRKAERTARAMKHDKTCCLVQALAIAAVALVLAGVPYFTPLAENSLIDTSVAMGISTFAMFVGAMLASTRMQAFMRAKKNLEEYCAAHSLSRADLR